MKIINKNGKTYLTEVKKSDVDETGHFLVPQVDCVGSWAFFCKDGRLIGSNFTVGLFTMELPEGWAVDSSKNCRNLKSVTFCEGVKSIEAFAFCHSPLSEISFPLSLENIGWSAFLGCNNLTIVTLPQFLKSLGVSSFKDCVNLRQIVMSEKLEQIEASCFENCYSLQSITLPKKITKVPKNCFYNCEKLKNITFNGDIDEMELGCFEGCDSLTEFYVPKNVAKINRYTFARCSNLASVYISENVREIEKHAFAKCYALKYVTLPKGVQIAPDAFEEDNKIKFNYYEKPKPEEKTHTNFKLSKCLN